MWSIEEIRGLDELDRLEGDWNRLLAACPEHTIFQTFAWCRTYAQHTADDSSLHILLLREGTALRGIVPLAIRRVRRAGLRLRRLETLGTGPSDRTGFLLPAGIPEAAHKAILEHVFQKLPAWDLWDWRGMMAEASGAVTLLDELRTRGLPLWEGPRDVLPLLRIAEPWDTFYERRFKAGDRSRVRQLWRKLEQRGKPVVRKPASVGEVQGLTARLLHMHHRGKGYGTAFQLPFAVPRLRAFMDAMTEVAARAGWLDVALLELDGKLIAYRYDFTYRDAAYAYFSGYDPAFIDCGPGRLLLTDYVRESFARGLKSFRFLRGLEAYKSAWTDDAEYNLNAVVFRPSPFGRLLRVLHGVGKT